MPQHAELQLHMSLKLDSECEKGADQSSITEADQEMETVKMRSNENSNKIFVCLFGQMDI